MATQAAPLPDPGGDQEHPTADHIATPSSMSASTGQLPPAMHEQWIHSGSQPECLTWEEGDKDSA